jgi:hypothetical protein
VTIAVYFPDNTSAKPLILHKQILSVFTLHRFYTYSRSKLLSQTNPSKNPGAIQWPPTCLNCGSTTRRKRASSDNHNGSADRPYCYCPVCDKFSCFADTRGTGNPICDCPGQPLSRLRLAGQDKVIVSYALHYQCAIGGCSYFSYMTDQEGRVVVYTGEVSKMKLMMMGL